MLRVKLIEDKATAKTEIKMIMVGKGWVNGGVHAKFWAMAKNGSTRCFFGQKRMYLKTITAESVVGRI